MTQLFSLSCKQVILVQTPAGHSQQVQFLEENKQSIEIAIRSFLFGALQELCSKILIIMKKYSIGLLISNNSSLIFEKAMYVHADKRFTSSMAWPHCRQCSVVPLQWALSS